MTASPIILPDDMPANVAERFARFPDSVRPELLDLRARIFKTAARLERVGPLTETLKWGEPSYLTQASKSGSTIRIGLSKLNPQHYGLYFNCKTTLVDTFRSLFPEHFIYEGNRGLLLPSKLLPCGETVEGDALNICIGKALLYHLDK